jgi:hypothetical protein
MAVTIISRSASGLRQWRKRAPRIVAGKRRGLTGHIVGSGKIARTADHSKCDDLVRSIQGWHQENNGWSDIAYSFLICPHGSIYEGRGWKWDQFANTPNGTSRDPRLEPAQDGWYTVCFLSGCGDPTYPAAMDAFEALRNHAVRNGLAGLEVTGHRDFKVKECPCDHWYAYLRRLNGVKLVSTVAKVIATVRPAVSLSKIREAARVDPPRRSSLARYPTGTKRVERALVLEGLLSSRYRDPVGHFGSETVKAYGRWQRRLGYRGNDANGIPGRISLTRLGNKYGFRVKG